jgi:DNA gyrase/topoisomerase IV subunit A
MGTKTMGESDASTSMPATAAKAGAPAKTKAPPTSYFLFASEVRPIVQAEVSAANGGKASIGTMGKAIGARWSALSDAEKQTYKERADAMKAAASASAVPAAEAEDAVDEGEDESASSSDGGDFVVGMSVLPTGLATEAGDSFDEDDASMESASGPWLLILSKKGYGKRVPVSSFRLQGRLGKGLKAARLPAGDSLAAAVIVGTPRCEFCDDDVLISTTNGMLLRVAINDISSMSRSARGSRIVKLKGGEVGTVTIINK